MRESEQATIQHIRRVQTLLSDVVERLIQRAIVHDASKLEEPEASVFDEFTPKLKDSIYGSEEYKQFLAEMKPALDHHYANNSHHPEYYRWHCPICSGQFSAAEYESAPQGPNDTGVRYCPECSGASLLYESELMDKPGLGIRGMTLLDLIEMLVDWKAAGERHENGSIAKSLEVNKKRFGYGDELQAILSRTVDELWGWETKDGTR
jgi:hypothetical protein